MTCLRVFLTIVLFGATLISAEDNLSVDAKIHGAKIYSGGALPIDIKVTGSSAVTQLEVTSEIKSVTPKKAITVKRLFHVHTSAHSEMTMRFYLYSTSNQQLIFLSPGEYSVGLKICVAEESDRSKPIFRKTYAVNTLPKVLPEIFRQHSFLVDSLLKPVYVSKALVRKAQSDELLKLLVMQYEDEGPRLVPKQDLPLLIGKLMYIKASLSLSKRKIIAWNEGETVTSGKFDRANYYLRRSEAVACQTAESMYYRAKILIWRREFKKSKALLSQVIKLPIGRPLLDMAKRELALIETRVGI